MMILDADIFSMGFCGTRPSTALSGPAALDYYHRPCLDNESTCACSRMCTCIMLVSRAPGFAAWLHSGTDGIRWEERAAERWERATEGATTRVASRRICRVSAPLSHALKRNAWGLSEGRTEGSGRPRELRAGIFIFSVCAGLPALVLDS